jgi:hypothetical protein
MDVHRSLFLVVTLGVGLAACGDGVMVPGDSNPRVILAAPSFATDINEIIQRRGCSASSCHGGPGGKAGLQFSSDAAANYLQLVNVQATSENFLRVAPSDPDNSYIVIKVEGRQLVGQRMPRGQSALDNIDLTNIRNWIGNGAPNN